VADEVATPPSDADVPFAADLWPNGFANCLLKNRYRIIERIGIGGMAEVYLAAHGQLAGFHTPVVIKRVLPHLASEPEFIEMFLDEARIAAALHHPNVVSILEVFRERGEYFLVMELVQGESLVRMLRKLSREHERVPPVLAAHIAAQVAAGLHHAHTYCDAGGQPLNIVHRDVSPQNILVTYEGTVKVIDFGVARAINRLTHTRSGGFKGKLGYSSPEQVRRDAVDARSDQFSLGVVLWEMLSGRRLFRRETELDTVNAILSQPAPPLRAFVDVPPNLVEVVDRALQKEPSERFENLQEMELALSRSLVEISMAGPSGLRSFMAYHFREEKSEWRRRIKSVLEVATPAPEGPPDTRNERPPGTRARTRSGLWTVWLGLSLTVLLSGLALGLAYHAYRGRSTPPAPALQATSPKPPPSLILPLPSPPEPASAAPDSSVPVSAVSPSKPAAPTRRVAPAQMSHKPRGKTSKRTLKPNPFRN
jgi:serine/threonine-protein kinase